MDTENKDVTIDSLRSAFTSNLVAQLSEATFKLSKREFGLQDVLKLTDAYPLDVFHEPDLEKARELLEAGGMSLDAVSACAMRDVMRRVAAVCESALMDY